MQQWYFLVCFLFIPNMISAQEITQKQAEALLDMPLACIQREYPNKLNQVLNTAADVQGPEKLHPSFYGCFDWHSAVHGHWSIVKLLSLFPNLSRADEAIKMIQENINPEKIAGELKYFEKTYNKSYERTYGWAWLLKLSEALKENPAQWSQKAYLDLKPLSQKIAQNFISYLPKLHYPLRIGTHNNTAFALSFAWDYAIQEKNTALQEAITKHALKFYLNDENCPLSWEPSGTDFLSPCWQEAELMLKILPEKDFKIWFKAFLPKAVKKNFELPVGIVSDRSDGHLVHLDGLNFSRAWCLYRIAKLDKAYEHLKEIADQHLKHSLPEVVGDDYEGGHWLASFALYAILQKR